MDIDIPEDIINLMNEIIVKIESPIFTIGYKRKNYWKLRKSKKMKVNLEFKYVLYSSLITL